MGKIVIALNDSDLMHLQEILLDQDETGALEFLNARIASQLPTKGTAACDSSRCNPYLLKPDGD